MLLLLLKLLRVRHTKEAILWKGCLHCESVDVWDATGLSLDNFSELATGVTRVCEVVCAHANQHVYGGW